MKIELKIEVDIEVDIEVKLEVRIELTTKVLVLGVRYQIFCLVEMMSCFHHSWLQLYIQNT